MTDNGIITSTKFSSSDIEITDLKTVNKNGKKSLQSLLLHNLGGEASQMYVETPGALNAVFGIKSYQKGDSGSSDYSINLSARSLNKDDQSAVNAWYATWDQVDELLIDFGVKNSKAIFGKQYTSKQREVVSALYTRCVKKDEGGEYPARLAPKIQRVRVKEGGTWKPTDKPDILVFKQSTAQEGYESFDELVKDCPPGTYVQAIIQPRLWFISGKFGLSLNVVQMQILAKKKGGKPTGFAFSNSLNQDEAHVDSENDDEDDEDDSNHSGSEVEDSNDEDDNLNSK